MKINYIRFGAKNIYCHYCSSTIEDGDVLIEHNHNIYCKLSCLIDYVNCNIEFIRYRIVEPGLIDSKELEKW